MCIRDSYKVVDSDDWLDTDALQKVLARLQMCIRDRYDRI